MKKLFMLSLALSLPFAVFAGQINIVASSTDIADIMKAVAGDKANVECLMKGTQDPHSVEPRPSMVVKVRNADIMAVVGMDLDMSEGIDKLDVPEGKIDARLGDVHIYGNPHYQLDPKNGIIMADEALKKLVEFDPADEKYFRANHDAFVKKLGDGIGRWNKMMEPLKGKKLAASHSCLLYFFNAFGIKQAGYIESKPGIPPSPSEVIALEKKIKDDGVKAVLVDQFFDMSEPEKISADTGAKTVVISTCVDGLKGTEDYIKLFDYDVKTVLDAVK